MLAGAHAAPLAPTDRSDIDGARGPVWQDAGEGVEVGELLGEGVEAALLRPPLHIRREPQEEQRQPGQRRHVVNDRRPADTSPSLGEGGRAAGDEAAVKTGVSEMNDTNNQHQQPHSHPSDLGPKMSEPLPAVQVLDYLSSPPLREKFGRTRTPDSLGGG